MRKEMTLMNDGGKIMDTLFGSVCILDENCQVQPVNAGFTAPFWNLHLNFHHSILWTDG